MESGVFPYGHYSEHNGTASQEFLAPFKMFAENYSESEI
jgi:hypothetical protein